MTSQFKTSQYEAYDSTGLAGYTNARCKRSCLQTDPSLELRVDNNPLNLDFLYFISTKLMATASPD